MQLAKFALRVPTIVPVKVRLLYFAVLRDMTGVSEEEMEVAPGTRPRDLWDAVRRRHAALADYSVPPMIAINESYAAADRELRDGDELAFIPPVSGG